MINYHLARAAGVELVVRKCRYKDWAFEVGLRGKDVFIIGRFRTPGSKTGAVIQHATRKWFISQYATHSEIVQTVFKLVLTAEEHEVREAFKYRDAAIFGPHFNVDMLVDFSRGKRNLDAREEKQT